MQINVSRKYEVLLEFGLNKVSDLGARAKYLQNLCFNWYSTCKGKLEGNGLYATLKRSKPQFRDYFF